jgi:phage baseplate assembly protein gpV
MIKKTLRDDNPNLEFFGNEYQAVIVDNKDPDKKNRVKIRVAGVHPSDLPEDQLPWTQVSPDLGSNQGQGSKKVLQKGQFCTVKPLNIAQSEWIVTGGSAVVREELNQKSSSSGSSGKQDVTADDKQPFSNVENKKLEKETIPKMASADINVLKTAVYGVLISKLLKTGDIFNTDPNPAPPPSVPSPELPPLLKLRAKRVDFTKFEDTVFSPFEKNLGSFTEFFYFYNTDPETVIRPCTLDNVNLELLNAEEIVGYDKDGNKAHPRLENGDLIIPPNIPYGENSTDHKLYVLKYKVTDKESEINTAENEIHFIVAGIDYTDESTSTQTVSVSAEEIIETFGGLIVQNTTTSNNVKVASTPDYAYSEFPPEDENGETEHKDVTQYPNGIAISIDGSDDNAYVSFKHPTGTRLDMFNDGRAILKSSTSMQLQQGQNLLVNTGNTVEMKVGSRINLKTPKLYIECDSIDIVANEINIKGDINIVGDINMQGNITLFGNITQTGNQQINGSVNVSGGDVVADGISLKNHTHREQGDGAPTSPPL